MAATGTRRGFTMIELLIAIALGLMLCGSVAAALRICAQSAAIANRLSLENGMMRSGVAAALHDLDFWESYDVPGDPTRQQLDGPGEPFAALTLPPEAHLDFDQSDAQNWWRGLGCKMNRPEYGRYAAFARIDHPLAERRRLAVLYRTIVDTLGYYAFCDYAPANAIWSYYDESGAVPMEFIASAAAPKNLGWDCGDSPGDLLMVLDGGAFALTRDAWYRANAVSHRQFFLWGATGAGWPAEWQHRGLHGCADPLAAMPARPAHWPKLAVLIRHFTGAYRQWHTATVTVASPISGLRQKLHLSTTSTTLRGARRMRGLDLGPAP
ncbi:MAG: prepilin-type N-terminal cleavage/methylation domain-containing protein [Planctomycetes bacterium]|nr:prepilin-type N-terminal cleavage/methylation domain-containing protein [Planctomycetota bacterium]